MLDAPPDRAVAVADPSPSTSDGDRRLLAIAIVVVLTPVVVTCAALVGRTWFPASDRAIEVLRITDVGGRHTPLTGPWSRFGWDHPGPVLFWLLAPFERLLGSRGVLVGVGAINAAALVTALLAARRRAGWPAVGVGAAAAIALVAALGTDLLIDPWNPWTNVLPYLAFMMAAWCVADGDHIWLPVLAGVGTFLVQTHVGYAPPVVIVGGVAIALGWSGARRAGAHGRARRSVLAAVAVAAVLWLPPVVQQLFGEHGNLGELVAYSLDPTEPAAGWARAWGVMGTELGFPGAWLTGSDDGLFGVRTSTVWPALAVIALAAGLGELARRRGELTASRLSVVALASVVAGLIATARVSGPVWTYVVRWWWVNATLVWVSIIWSACVLVGRPEVRRWIGTTALAASALVSVVLGWRATPVVLPDQELSVASGVLGADASSRLDSTGRYIVHYADVRNWGAIARGLFVELDRRGYHVAAPPEDAPPHELWQTQAPAPGWTSLLVVGEDDAVNGFPRPPGAVAIARFDPLTAPERSRADDLRARVLEVARAREPAITVGTAVGQAAFGAYPLNPSDVDELLAYRARGSAYTVYVLDS